MIVLKQGEEREQEMGTGLAVEADAAPPPEVDSMLPQSAPHREGMRDDRAILEEEQRRHLASWQQQGMRKLHEAALDPEKHFADMDLSYGSTREEGAAMLITESYLRLTNGGRTYRNPIGRDMARDRTAHEHFGGKGAGSDLEFGRQVIERARKNEAGIELFGRLSRAASTAEIVRGAVGQGEATTWQQWLTEARKHPGYDPAREADYLEKWNEVTSDTRGRTAAIAAPLRDVFQALRGGDLNPAKFAEGLRPEHRETFLAGLRMLAETLPANEQASFWGNLSKHADRFTMGAAQNIADFATTPLEAPEPAEPVTVWPKDEVGNFFRDLERDNYKQAKRYYEANEAARAEARARKNLRDDINRVRDTVYDPVKALNPEGTWARLGEDIAYSLPAMAGYAATAAIPGGVVAIYADAKGRIYTELRHGLMESMGDAAASEFAETWSGVAAVPYVLIEKVQLAAPLKRVRGLEKLLHAATRRIGNQALRAGGRVVLTGVGETVGEEFQNVLPSLVREVGSLLDEEVEGVEWLNGKDGYLDGFWYRSAVSFGTMLPLAMLAGIPGKGTPGRNQALAEARDVELRALGIAPDQVAAIRTAEGKGDYRLNAAIDWALATRDPMSEDAKAAVAEMEAQAREEEQVLEQAGKWGLMPVVVSNGEKGFTVRDGMTGEEIGKATTVSGAKRIAAAHQSTVEEAEAVRVAQLAHQAESAGVGKHAAQVKPFDKSRANLGMNTGASAGSAARVMTRARAREISAGKRGIIDLVMGKDVGELSSRTATVARRISEGEGIRTTLRMETRAFVQAAFETGTLSRGRVLKALERTDFALTKPGGGARRHVVAEKEWANDAMLEEMVADVIESEVLRRPVEARDGSEKALPAALLSRQNAPTGTASAEAKDLRTFANAVRDYFGLVLEQAGSRRDGGMEDDADLIGERLSKVGKREDRSTEEGNAIITERIVNELLARSNQALEESEVRTRAVLFAERMEMTVEELEILKSPHEILLIYTAEGKLKNVIQGTRAGHVYRGEIIEGGIFCHNHPGRRGPSDTDLRFALDHPGVTVRVVMKTKEGRRVIYRIRGKGKVDEKTIRRITECYGNECRAQGDDAAARDKALELTLHEFGDYLSVETALL